MKHLFIFIFTFQAVSLAFAQQQVIFRLKDVRDSVAILAYHYGSKKLIYDSIPIDATGKAVITPKEGDLVIPGGIYLFAFPKGGYLEFILTEPRFEIITSQAHPIRDLQVKGSRENKAFFADLQIVHQYSKQIDSVAAQLKNITDEHQKSKLELEIEGLRNQLENARDSLAKAYPGTFYAKIIRAMQTPEPPKATIGPDGNIDPNAALQYYREHYWDYVDFADERLIRTPLLEYKLNYYLDHVIIPHPDSLIAAIDQLLFRVFSEGSEEMKRFFLTLLVNRYARKAERYMGMDEVYVHLVLNYVALPSVTWIDSAQRIRMVSRALQMEPLLIDKRGPNVIVEDAQGTKHALYDVDADYTIVLYWTPDCGHCRKYVPELARQLDTLANESTFSFKVFAIYTKHDKDLWVNFLKKHHLAQRPNWIHVYNPDDKDYEYKLAYDAFSTPTIYILDRHHTIIAKKLGPKQVRDFLKRYHKDHAKSGP